MIDPLGIQSVNLSDARAEIQVVGADSRVNGELYGPVCAYARTLRTQHPIAVTQPRPSGEPRVQIVVTDPCYWTPSLPFLYELVLRQGEPESTYHESRRMIGLRRLFPKGITAPRRSGTDAFQLESERYVFRGACIAALQRHSVDEAHNAEMALVISSPDSETCAVASERGVFLIVDLRGLKKDLLRSIVELAWRPSVAMVVLNSESIDARAADVKRRGLWIAQAADSSTASSAINEFADAIAVELEPGERPPAWIGSCCKPVIAIRRGRAYPDFYQARAACDRLQAELAPEFDLAGYFV